MKKSFSEDAHVDLHQDVPIFEPFQIGQRSVKNLMYETIFHIIIYATIPFPFIGGFFNYFFFTRNHL